MSTEDEKKEANEFPDLELPNEDSESTKAGAGTLGRGVPVISLDKTSTYY